MRPPQKSNRARGRGNRKPNGGNNLNRVFESAGPEGKVRGTPQQIIEKYIGLARDAQTSGDRVTAENFLQHAEHYQRILIQATGMMQDRAQGGQAQVETDDDDDDDDDLSSPMARFDMPRFDPPRQDPPRYDQPRQDQGRQDQPRQDQGRSDQPRHDGNRANGERAPGEGNRFDRPRHDQRGDPRQDSRADPRQDNRADPRQEPRGDPRPEPRGDARQDTRGDPRVDPGRAEQPRLEPRPDPVRADPPRREPARPAPVRADPADEIPLPESLIAPISLPGPMPAMPEPAPVDRAIDGMITIDPGVEAGEDLLVPTENLAPPAPRRRRSPARPKAAAAPEPEPTGD